MLQDSGHSVTELLHAWNRGDKDALDELIPLVQRELRQLARARLARERADHTLQPTALVNEAYLRLVGQHHAAWQDRAHFFAIAARMMRRILIDHARKRRAKRRDAILVSLDDGDGQRVEPDFDALDVDRALKKLTALHARQGEIVELKFFGGLTVEEIAEVLRVAPVTVRRDWASAKAWLYRELRSTR